MIAIIDYGASNLSSVSKAIARVGYHATVTTDAATVLKADAVILPGVGAAGDAMEKLKSLGMTGPIATVIKEGRPFLGLCLGLQVLFTSTEESGGYACLDVVAGKVRKLPPGVKVPHMGWNQVRQRRKDHPLFEGIPDNANFYFVHSYYAEPAEPGIVAADTEYGVSFCSVLIKGNLVATQFHPEKSGELGLRLYQNFFKFSLGG